MGSRSTEGPSAGDYPSPTAIEISSYAPCAIPRFWANAERDMGELAKYYHMQEVGEEGAVCRTLTVLMRLACLTVPRS